MTSLYQVYDGWEKSSFTNAYFVNFSSPRDFIERGFGYFILRDDEIVSIASTFAVCKKGIEIQINTRVEHQGKGLAVHALKHHLDPNWDAANEISAGLAKKLGYTSQGTYTMIIYTGSAP